MTLPPWMIRHKKPLFAACAVLAAGLLALYFWALFRPGYWYNGMFLARRQAGVFSGQNWRGTCLLQMEKTDGEATLSFTLNGESRNYRVVFPADGLSAKIYENDSLIFTGQPYSMGDWYILMDEAGNPESNLILQVHSDVECMEEPLQFPSLNQIYTWAASDQYETFGTPMFLLPILLLAVCLAVDLRFPNFFFLLRHGLAVDGGEPSDWYHTGQKFTRVILVLGMLYCVGASLLTH